jgi:hypothetical protein
VNVKPVTKSNIKTIFEFRNCGYWLKTTHPDWNFSINFQISSYMI